MKLVQTKESKTLGLSAEPFIDHQVLVEIAEKNNFELYDILKGTSVYIEPKPEPPPKSAEYMTFMHELRVQQQERDYQDLVRRGVDPAKQGQIKLPSSDAKEIKEQVTTIFNILISAGAVAFAVWRWMRWYDLGVRTLACIFSGIFILIAEVVVYSAYKRRIGQAREVERRKDKEIKAEVLFEALEKELKPEPKPEPLGRVDRSRRNKRRV